ncbi:MAG TPA: EAL domain-containing protein [Allosphingosinicella sp.]|jgi:EAL domain-containing protein (putative c-di-GMP-specific phosphodiesterase class I)/CHASE2 domain-containing sensor protein
MLIRIADLFARRAGIAMLALALVAGLSAAAFDMARPMENGLEEIRHTAFRKNASGETIVVAIDSRTLAQVGDWPFQRSTHARLIDRLRESGARNIVFDVVFADPAADPAQDRALAGAIARANGRVVLPALLENTDEEFGSRTESLPAASVRQGAQIGTIWIRLDGDGLARHLPYSVDIAGTRRPALATYLADGATTQSGNFELDWSIDPATIPTVSYSDVLEGRIPRAFLDGKNVIIGATSSTLGDRFFVPSHNRIPGVYIQAVGSETLRRFPPREVGAWPTLALVIAIVAGAAFVRRPGRRVAILCAALAAALVLPMLLRELTGIVALPGAAATAALTGLFTSGAAAITAAVLARVTLAPVSQIPNLTAMSMASPQGIATVAVRLRNHVETTALLGSEAQGELMRRVADRITLAAGGAQMFQVDDHSFAWRALDSGSTTSDALEGLHALLASGIPVGTRTVDVTIAVGISDDPSLGTSEAVAAAMAAASQAERHGLAWERYCSDESEDANWRLSLLNELDRAIDLGHVWVAYQPKFDLRAGSVCGAEALVRWSHPVRGEIRPDQFIPTLEDNGRIEKLTLHVLETAIRDFAALDDDLTVAINISAKMIGRNRLLEPIAEMLAHARMDAQRLTLEITESAALAGSAGIDELNSLRNLGVHISIDDYGTGQSTLSYLKRLPATELKIDRSFVQVIATSRSDAAVVDSTVKLAHALGLVVVAEGVESEEVLNLLRQMNCDLVQGYYFGEPTSIRNFVNRLRMPNQLRAGRRR